MQYRSFSSIFTYLAVNTQQHRSCLCVCIYVEIGCEWATFGWQCTWYFPHSPDNESTRPTTNTYVYPASM